MNKKSLQALSILLIVKELTYLKDMTKKINPKIGLKRCY